MANKQEIFEILTILSAAYPRFELTKETVTAYTMLLEDLDTESLRAAAKECATKRTFFPSVHELRKTVVEMRRKGARIPTSFEAWNEVINAGPGSWKEVDETENGYEIISKNYRFSHPMVEKVARLLGWPARFPGDNQMSDRSQFLKAYEQAVYDAMDYEITLPEVREFIESQRHKALVSSSQDEKLGMGDDHGRDDIHS